MIIHLVLTDNGEKNYKSPFGLQKYLVTEK